MEPDIVSRPSPGIALKRPDPIEIPIDANPDALTGKYLEKNGGLLADARNAARAVWNTWTTVKEIESQVTDKNALADATRKATERALREVEPKVKRLREHREQLETRIDGAVRPKARDTFGAEVRDYLNKQPKPFLVASRMIQDGDQRSVGEVLAAPAFLSGLTKKQHTTLIGLARTIFSPQDSGLQADLDKAIARIERSTDQMVTQMATRIHLWRNDDTRELERLNNG